jgi:hypothetical protein
MFKNLLQKIAEFAKNRPPEDAPTGPPDPDEDTMRELPDKEEKTTHWVNIFKLKF